MLPLNLPNVLTVLRILLVPVLVVALLGEIPHGDLWAAIVFALASLTDLADGWLARHRGSITTFGKLADPIADKLLVIGALIALVSLERVAPWVAMVIIAREFAVTALRSFAVQQGVVIPASPLGKVKTVAQVAMIMGLILADGAVWVDVLVYATVAVTVASGLDYFFGLRRRLAEGRAAEAARRRAGRLREQRARPVNSE